MSAVNQGLENELKARRTPCLVTFLHPFRIVDGPDSPEWQVSLDEINAANWDYVALHEIVGGIGVGLESPYHMIVCRDGGLALPLIPELQTDQAAVENYNRILAAILLGGIYCEEITSDGLDFGSILDWKYVRVLSCAFATSNRFHFLLRGQHASAVEAIALEEPRCQRRLKIRPKGGAKDCHLGWWSDLGVRLGVGDAVRGFFGGSGQRSHAELKRSAPAGRPQGGMVYRIGVSLATRALGARCRPGPSDGVPQFSYRHCFCGRGFG